MDDRIRNVGDVARRTLILGSGFGLYGYLPAVLAEPFAVAILADCARESFEARQELQMFRSRVEFWTETEMPSCRASRCVIAKPPAQQELEIQQLPTTVRQLVLEKPVAMTPQRAAALLTELSDRVQFRVGYTLLHTKWFKDLKQALDSRPGCPAHIDIDWRFRAHHVVNQLPTWKRRHHAGGGALRFYGIHLLALLAAIGDWRPFQSKTLAGSLDEPHTWLADFESLEGRRASIGVRSDAAETRFEVKLTWEDGCTGTTVQLREPFQSTEVGSPFFGQDSRVAVLQLLLASFEDADEIWHDHAQLTNSIWAETERNTTAEIQN